MGTLWCGVSLLCPKLSNSGDTVKLLVPSGVGNSTRGWINYSGMVINQKMVEREVGYHGSKSITCLYVRIKYRLIPVIVKEQRVCGSCCIKFMQQWVCGSCCINFMQLRSTLTGFERNHLIGTPFKQVYKQKRFFFSIAVQQNKKSMALVCVIHKINPYFITGFVDGEGSFVIRIRENNKLKVGWNVELSFQIGIHSKDKALLEQIKNYFGGVGKISKSGSNLLQFRVSLTKDLQVVISHFEQFPLITQKQADYELWRSAYNIIQNKGHLTEKGLYQILALKARLNKGFTPVLKTVFPHIIPVERPLVTDQIIKDCNWLAGFVSGEGCFYVRVFKSNTTKEGWAIQLVFIVVQHYRDKELLQSLMEYFNCGRAYRSKEAFTFQVTKFSDLNRKIIPFFVKYPIKGIKAKDFEDFCKVAELMQNKVHLTKEGLELIRKIKAGMNTGRDWN